MSKKELGFAGVGGDLPEGHDYQLWFGRVGGGLEGHGKGGRGGGVRREERGRKSQPTCTPKSCQLSLKLS